MENLVGYAKRDLIIPGVPFVDLTAANSAAAAWCAEVNTAVHSETAAVPADRLFVERPLLGPLPSLRLTATIGAAVSRKVDRLSCVRFASARYSVPTVWIGATVHLRAAEGRLAILDPVGDEIVATHPLVASPRGRPRPVLRRTRPKPRWDWADRAVLAALIGRLATENAS